MWLGLILIILSLWFLGPQVTILLAILLILIWIAGALSKQ